MRVMHTFDTLSQVVGETLGVDRARLRPTSRIADLGLDSLQVVSLVVALEKTFDLTIPPARLEAARTLGDVAAYLERGSAATDSL